MNKTNPKICISNDSHDKMSSTSKIICFTFSATGYILFPRKKFDQPFSFEFIYLYMYLFKIFLIFISCVWVLGWLYVCVPYVCCALNARKTPDSLELVLQRILPLWGQKLFPRPQKKQLEFLTTELSQALCLFCICRKTIFISFHIICSLKCDQDVCLWQFH